jgi:two-component system, NtrC family, sensor kinase
MRQGSRGVKAKVDAKQHAVGGGERKLPKAKVKPKRLVAKKVPKRQGCEDRESEQRLAEALEREKAIGEILRVMSISPGDVQPVLEAVAERAAHLCDSPYANVWIREGDKLHPSAFSRLPQPANLTSLPLTRGSVNGRAVLDGKIIHHADIVPFLDTEYPDGRQNLQRLGIRAHLAVPLLRDGEACGTVTVFRREPRPFSPEQITLVETFARQAVIAIENARLFNETKEALEQQTATSEILRVISQSRRDVQPVFDTIAHAALKLCHATSGTLTRYDGELLHVGAIANFDPNAAAAIRSVFPRPAGRDTTVGRTVLTRSVVEIPDVLIDADYDKTLPLVGAYRGRLSVPLMREGEAIGGITVHRLEPGHFSDKQIALLKTFADQAVIAIENVWLFNETKEALEQQTAISEILRVISTSPTNIQPVLDAIAERALSLCDATQSVISLVEGSNIRFAAGFGTTRTFVGEAMPLSRGLVAGRAIVDRATIHLEDVAAVSEDEYPIGLQMQRSIGHRTLLGVPLMREDRAIGAVTLWRMEVRPFTDKQISLVKTFADQAAIAIENVRLFNETKDALERQTATSEILRVISQSPRDVQPVFDSIAASAMRLCGGSSVTVTTYDGQLLHLVALATATPEGADAVRKIYPRPASPETAASRAVFTCGIVAIPDVLEEPDLGTRATAVAGGFRSVVAVPLLLDARPIGAIAVGRPEPGSFPDKQIALLQTFADQAVIAIENVRLFTELETRTLQLARSVEELKALGEVGQAVSSTLDLETVLATIVSRAAQLAGMDGGSIWEYDEAREEFHLHATDRAPDELVEALRAMPIRKGEGALGRLAMTGEPVQIRDIAEEPNYPSHLRQIGMRGGLRSVLAVPLLREHHLLGALTVNRNRPGEFSPEVIELLKTFATQSALAIQNARLFREVEVKSRELETASRHKSEFLANMSHELRTPLNAIIGFSEVLSERMFGEINEKQAEYIGDILESGQHLLSLINDILDLSKIEAGRMELELSDLDLPITIENTLILVRERAQRRAITLERTVEQRLGPIRADERKVKQVLLNLLSNALKFTPEGGKVNVSAATQDGMVEISVTDSGVGIAPADQEAVFEEFRQVGTASKKVEGTGLGLAISRKFIELHGGKIWVKSTVGSGSTFTFTLPLQ